METTWKTLLALFLLSVCLTTYSSSATDPESRLGESGAADILGEGAHDITPREVWTKTRTQIFSRGADTYVYRGGKFSQVSWPWFYPDEVCVVDLDQDRGWELLLTSSVPGEQNSKELYRVLLDTPELEPELLLRVHSGYFKLTALSDQEVALMVRGSQAGRLNYDPSSKRLGVSLEIDSRNLWQDATFEGPVL